MSKIKFTLDKIIIDPAVHIRLVRHAKENASFKAFGLLYGAMYDDLADVTGVVPFPVHKPVQLDEDSKQTGQIQGQLPLIEEKREDEEGEAAKRKYEEVITKFELDEHRLGRYVVTYRKDFWSEIKNTKIMEGKQNTSFLLVLDYSLLQTGANPYRAYRLKREYAEKPVYNWSEISVFDPVQNNPFVEIKVEVAKTTLFEALVQFNKKQLLQPLVVDYSEDRNIQSEIQNFETVIGNQIGRLQVETDIFMQSKNESNRSGIPLEQYNEFLSKSSTIQNYTRDFKRHGTNLIEAQALFQSLEN